MSKVIIDMTMSLDGYVAGPNDGPDHPLGEHDGMRIFDWYTSGPRRPGDSDIAHPEPGINQEVVDEMFAESGAFIFGRRTYDITHGWDGAHPVHGVPVFVLTHKPPPPATVPKGPSNLAFITDGIESAVRQAKAAAGSKNVRLGGASPCKQALAAGLVDEILVHVAPHVMGGGVRLFDEMPAAVGLEIVSVRAGPLATHLHYRVKPRR